MVHWRILHAVLSVCFALGLFNGSGIGLVNNLCQICFAIVVGFLLVTIFYRGGSLLPCIIVHLWLVWLPLIP